MQCGVASVDVMTNRDEEVRSWILATRSDPKGTRDQGGRLIEHSRGPAVVTRGDRGEEREQRIIEVMGSPTWLHHRYRLSNLGPGCSGQVSYHVDRREANAGAAQGSGMPDTEQLAVMPCPRYDELRTLPAYWATQVRGRRSRTRSPSRGSLAYPNLLTQAQQLYAHSARPSTSPARMPATGSRLERNSVHLWSMSLYGHQWVCYYVKLQIINFAAEVENKCPVPFEPGGLVRAQRRSLRRY